MKILHLLAVGTIVNASQTIEENKHDTLNMNLNSLQDELRSLGNTDYILHSQESNHKEIETISSSAIGNPITTEDKEIDEILDTLFFNFLKQAVSFYLYNISTLRPIFIDIHNKRAEEQADVRKLKTLLFKCITAFKVATLRELIEAEENADAFQLEHIIRCFEGHLNIQGIPCENLSYAELKKEVLSTDLRFFFSSAEFNSQFDRLKSEFYQYVSDYFKFDEQTANMVLTFSTLIRDTISNFNSIFRHSLNVNQYPFLKHYKWAFEWAIETAIQLLNAPISESFSNEINDSSTFNRFEVQHVSGFILALFKIAQFRKYKRFFKHDIFLQAQQYLSKLFRNSSMNNNIAEELISIFQNFSNEVASKRIELKKLEEQTDDIFVYPMLEPIVNEFLRAVITKIGNGFSPETVRMRPAKR